MPPTGLMWIKNPLSDLVAEFQSLFVGTEQAMGKGGNKAFGKTSGPAENEVLIDGKYYDVSNLKHPGGSVIKFYQGFLKRDS